MIKLYNLVLIGMLPFVYGCLGGGGGSGSSASAGSIVSGGSIGGGSGSEIGAGIGSGLETIHNPEPATALLIGGGALAMAYYRKYKK